jgi:hypothetical protein
MQKETPMMKEAGKMPPKKKNSMKGKKKAHVGA